MTRFLLLLTIFFFSLSPAQAAVFAEKKGDKLLECQFQKASEMKPDATDISDGDKFAAFFPVARKGDFGFRDGREFIDPLKIRTFDPSNIFGGMKVNIYIDQADRSGFIAGAVVASLPLMLVVDPAQRTGERYFTAVA
ncbi:MAG: hypothetical protein JF564_01100, partial [Sphingomonas sp.]|nr:hypothetical protein [Sphingomonas sp.]